MQYHDHFLLSDPTTMLPRLYIRRPLKDNPHKHPLADSGKIRKIMKRVSTTHFSLGENEDNTERIWIIRQIKAIVWNMLRNIRLEKPKEYEIDNYFSSGVQRRYVRTT